MYGYVNNVTTAFYLFDSAEAAEEHARAAGLGSFRVRAVSDHTTPSVQATARRRAREAEARAARRAAPQGEMASFLALGQ